MPAHCCPPDASGVPPGYPVFDDRQARGWTRADVRSIPAVRGLHEEAKVRNLTKRQQEILSFILRSIARDGRFPSYREIGAHFGLSSPATVSQHLEALGREVRQLEKELTEKKRQTEEEKKELTEESEACWNCSAGLRWWPSCSLPGAAPAPPEQVRARVA